MKKISILILTLLVAMAACKKVPEVNKEYVDVERDLITVGTTTATIQCDYEYIATLKKAYLYYGEGEDATDMNVAEMSVVQNILCVGLSGLKENTTYSYYYEFVNGFNSMRTALKSFKTEVSSGDGTGALLGLFSVAPNKKVRFSQGNLQFQASTGIWRFAEHQWDFVGSEVVYQGEPGGNVTGSSNHLVSDVYDGWIDLFGWGTSGYNHGAVCYQPWSTSSIGSDYYAYGSYTYNLYDKTGQADWGYNPIINGGNHEYLWRTLKQEEMRYVFYSRGVEVSFVRAVVNGVKGVMLLPDNWDATCYQFNNPNVGNNPYSDNVISSMVWSDVLEPRGAVFFPAAGLRRGLGVALVNSWGQYALSSTYDESQIYRFGFDEGITVPSDVGSSWRDICFSVRLAQDATPQPSIQTPTVITSDISNVTSNSAICRGDVTSDGGTEVTERGICWSVNANPTLNDSYVTAGAGTGSFTAAMNGLEANATYHVRAYATNEAGIAYGQDVEFTTLQGGGSGEHEYVDLGLPSGTLWATCNVGANAPEEYGDYFAWAEIETKTVYDWSTYKYCNGNSNALTKYCYDSFFGNNGFVDTLTVLQPSDDAVIVNWGDDWRIPTAEQWIELKNNTSRAWVSQNGVNGCLFSASNGNSVFLPAAGSRKDNEFINVGIYGNYWTATLEVIDTDDPRDASVSHFASNYHVVYGSIRSLGSPIRAVRK